MNIKLFAAALFVAAAFTTATQAQTKKRKAGITSNSSLSMSIAAGKKVYMQYCLTCHQADGAGVQRMNPPLINTDYVKGDKARIINIILKGFSEDVEINGNYYSNTMPSLDVLKDQEIADVLTYVRNSFGNKYSPVTIADVKKVRVVKK